MVQTSVSTSRFCTVFITLTLNVEQIYKLRKFGWKKKCLNARIIKNKCT